MRLAGEICVSANASLMAGFFRFLLGLEGSTWGCGAGVPGGGAGRFHLFLVWRGGSATATMRLFIDTMVLLTYQAANTRHLAGGLPRHHRTGRRRSPISRLRSCRTASPHPNRVGGSETGVDPSHPRTDPEGGNEGAPGAEERGERMGGKRERNRTVETVEREARGIVLDRDSRDRVLQEEFWAPTEVENQATSSNGLERG